RRGARRRLCRQKRVCSHACGREQQNVQQEEPVQSPEADERRRNDRIDQRLAEVQASRIRIRSLDDLDKGICEMNADFQLLAALEKNAVGAAVIQTGKAFEIAAFK